MIALFASLLDQDLTLSNPIGKIVRTDPLHQFAIKKYFSFKLLGLTIDFTNSSLMMLIITLCSVLFFTLAIRKGNTIPNKFQLCAEIFYDFIGNIMRNNVGKDGQKYFKLIFTLFTFVLFANLFGLFGFTVTSHFIVTLALASIIFFITVMISIVKHGFKFFTIFIPPGTPWWMSWLMLILEFFSYISKPISLSVRLSANMIAGHVMLEVIAGFIMMMGIAGIFPFLALSCLTFLEFCVAVLQAYIFTLLSCVYISEALNPSH